MGLDQFSFVHCCSPSTRASPRPQESKAQNGCCCSVAPSLLKDRTTSVTQGPTILCPVGQATEQRLRAPGLQQQLLQIHMPWGHVFPQPSNLQPLPAHFAHGEGPARQPQAARGSSPPRGATRGTAFGLGTGRGAQVSLECSVTPPVCDGAGRHGHGSLEELCCPEPARHIRNRLLPLHQRPPELSPVWLSVFHTSSCWSWDSEHFYLYTQNKKIKENKPATMRFCLNSGTSKAGRGSCRQSVHSALPHRPHAAPSRFKGFCFNEFMDQLAENCSGRQEKVTLPCSWASSDQKCSGQDTKPWQKEKMKHLISF